MSTPERGNYIHITAMRKLLADARASQIAEAALVLPLVFMMLLGIYWFGRAFNIYATINHAAREGARVGVAQSCATCSPPNAASTAPQVANAVVQALRASHVDVNNVILYNPSLTACPSSGGVRCDKDQNVTFCKNVQLSPNSSPGPPACGVTVSFQYPYQFWLPFTSLNNQRITLTADVQMQGEY